MKAKLLAFGFALLCGVTSARAQVFDAGYTFTYYFPTLPSSQQTAIIPETGFFLSPYFQDVTATVQWEIFDSLPSGVPVHSGIWTPGNPAYAPLFDQTWLDGEGSFRITILSGSQLIDNYFIYVARPEAVGFTVFSATVPATVPEPSIAALLALGLSAFARFAVRRKSSNPAMESKTDRGAPYFEMTSTLPLRSTRGLVRRRSSCSR
jgi:PEP-CTERM motif